MLMMRDDGNPVVTNELWRGAWMGMVVGAVATQAVTLLARRRLANAKMTFGGAVVGGASGGALAAQAAGRVINGSAGGM